MLSVKIKNILRKKLKKIPGSVFLKNILYIRNKKIGFERKKTKTIIGIKIKRKAIKYKSITFPNYITPLVSIIIPVFNQYEYTINCLDSIKRHIGDIPFEVIIADDCSTDETKYINNKIKNIIVSRNETNLGFIKNCNNAAKLARGKYLYFLNNDTEVQPNWLKELLNVIETHSDIGVVGSKIINANGTLQECGVFIFSDCIHNKIRGKSISNEKYDCLFQCDYVSGCSLLTPKSLFDEIGGFDEKFCPAYCEDPDYCLTALSKGFKTYVQPKSKVIHFGSFSYDSNSECLKERNNRILREKWQDYYMQRSEYDPRKDCSGIKRKASILVVDDWLPQFDKHAGGKTIFHFLELFKRMDLNVKFCPLFSNYCEEPYYSILTNMGIEIISNGHIHSWINDNIGYLDYILLSRPQVAEHFMIKAIKAKGVKVFYYGHDLHHVRMTAENAYSNNSNNREIEKMKKLEQSAISFCDIAFYPSDAEKQYINNVFQLNNVEVIAPYLYDSNKMIKHCSFEDSKDILFVGSSHGPNLDGLLWFIHNIFPIVVKRIPDICLNIVGSSVANEILAIKSPNIKIIGYLSEEKLSNLYSKTRLAIAPLRYGEGIKGKIIDSLYHSTPVVTTAIGIEGIDNSYGLIKCSDVNEEFAQIIIDLYTNSDEFEKLSPLYSKFIQENYSFSVAEKTFKQFIDTSERENTERVI